MMANKGYRFPVEPLTGAEALALFESLGKLGEFRRYGRATCLRNRALFVVMWRGGLRIKEALGLEPRDMDGMRGAIRVRRGKGGRARVIGLDGRSLEVMNEWMVIRRELGWHKSKWVFCRPDLSQVGYDGYRKLLQRKAKELGIERRVHPHGLRHTMAYELANEGVPIHVIQAQLGHASISMTQRYISHLAPTKLVSMMREREWRTEGE